MIYRLLYQLVLRRLDPERLHRIASAGLGAAGRIRPLRGVLRALLAPRDARLRVRALGLDFPSPLGAAAGLDKEADWFEGLGGLGFGFVEVGTVTAQRQPGNPEPRLVRLPVDRALLNRLGFPNPGAAAVGRRLSEAGRQTAVGVNVGRSKATSADESAGDYRACVREAGGCADYIAVNVSSPNTPGLRDLQAVERLRPVLDAVTSELGSERRAPVLVKIGPDLADEELDAVADLAVALGLDGIIATNTTSDRGGLSPSSALNAFEGGGVSGEPLGPRSLAVLRRLRERVGDRIVLISVGGIATPDDAWERILAGATLVQAYTGFVYGGPLWPWSMNRALARRVRRARVACVQDLVGASAGQGWTRDGRADPARISADLSAAS